MVANSILGAAIVYSEFGRTWTVLFTNYADAFAFLMAPSQVALLGARIILCEIPLDRTTGHPHMHRTVYFPLTEDQHPVFSPSPDMMRRYNIIFEVGT